jgi:hypothetical protein
LSAVERPGRVLEVSIPSDADFPKTDGNRF